MMSLRRVFATLYTLDSRFVLSGSDDSNLRIWKARASEKLGVIDKREMARKEYRDGLREKWGSVAEVAKLERCVFSYLKLHSPLSTILTLAVLILDNDSSLSRFTTPRSCVGLCWTLDLSRRRTAERMHPRVSMLRHSSPSRLGRLLLLESRTSAILHCLHHILSELLLSQMIHGGSAIPCGIKFTKGGNKSMKLCASM